MHAGDDQQWAVMLLRNEVLTADTLNAITLQLTAGAIASKKLAKTVTLDFRTVKGVAAEIIADADNPDPVGWGK